MTHQNNQYNNEERCADDAELAEARVGDGVRAQVAAAAPLTGDIDLVPVHGERKASRQPRPKNAAEAFLRLLCATPKLSWSTFFYVDGLRPSWLSMLR